MNVDLSSKRALVTGCTGLIGQAICRRLASSGADLVCTYFSDHEGAEALQAELEGLGSQVTMLQCNFGYPEEAETLLAELRALGSVDVFVWGAASGVMRWALEMKPKHWQWSLDVNAKTLLTLTQGLVVPSEGQPALMGSGGRIVALSSLGSSRAIPQYAAVGASKAAMESLARNLALELGRTDITVNVVSPGIVPTRALDHFPNRDELLELAVQKTPMGRLVTPADVAGVVLFLCSDEASMISGQTLHVDGGYSIVA